MISNTAYAQNAYTNTMVNTSATPLDLTIMLYDGAVGFLSKAALYMNQGDIAQKTHYIARTVAIIEELIASLNHEVGAEIAANLQSLYIYMLKELTLANANNDVTRIRQVEGLLRELRTAWKEIR